MWSVELVDPDHRIIELVWSGKISPEEVPQANEKLREVIDQLDGQPFDMIVDMREFISFPAATQHLIAEQQKFVIESGMRRSAVIVKTVAVKAGLNMISRKSGHTREFHFDDREEALKFLREAE